MDGGVLPALLVENKVDLAEYVGSDQVVKEFAETNKFCGHFRTSAKMGININESMEFLIKNIIERMEEFCKDGQIPVEKDRKSIVLETAKYSTVSELPVHKSYCC